MLGNMFHWFSEYILRDGPFDLADDTKAQPGFDLMVDAIEQGYFRSRPADTWINRHLLGLRVMLCRLRAVWM